MTITLDYGGWGRAGSYCNGRENTFCLILILSDSLTRKYAGTNKPHVRMTELVIDPARLTFVDVCTSSHNHTDHLDAETLNPLLASNPEMKLIIPAANRAFVAERLGCDPAWPIGLNDGESFKTGAFDAVGCSSSP